MQQILKAHTHTHTHRERSPYNSSSLWSSFLEAISLGWGHGENTCSPEGKHTHTLPKGFFCLWELPFIAP